MSRREGHGITCFAPHGAPTFGASHKRKLSAQVLRCVKISGDSLKVKLRGAPFEKAPSEKTAHYLIYERHLYKFCLGALNAGFLTGMCGSVRTVVGTACRHGPYVFFDVFTMFVQLLGAMRCFIRVSDTGRPWGRSEGAALSTSIHILKG